MGSVKDLHILRTPTEEQPGVGRFLFSDRYSVFDWGEMPDLINHKGRALAVMGAYFFELLEKQGILTHYQGLVENGLPKRLSELNKPSNTMQVSIVRVIKPELQADTYDYSVYDKNLRNVLIPLEVIYRNSLPAGSSVFKRLKDGSLSLSEIGLDKMPQPNDRLITPILDVSTKLEITDRYMSWKEAQKLSALSSIELKNLKKITEDVNTLISERALAANLINEDGKIEFAFDENRNLMLVDVLGTPDECRFTFAGMPVSKEIARIFYRNSDWYKMVEEAKQIDRANWKTHVKSDPPHLSKELLELISQLYCAVCNEMTQRKWFLVPELKKILDEIQRHF